MVAIIEVIKRIVNDLDFHFMPAIQIFLYLIFFISLIIAFCTNISEKELACFCGSLFCLFITWIIEIILFFVDLFFDEKQLEESMNFFIIFKICSLLIVIGIDITFLMILICKK